MVADEFAAGCEVLVDAVASEIDGGLEDSFVAEKTEAVEAPLVFFQSSSVHSLGLQFVESFAAFVEAVSIARDWTEDFGPYFGEKKTFKISNKSMKLRFVIKNKNLRAIAVGSVGAA